MTPKWFYLPYCGRLRGVATGLCVIASVTKVERGNLLDCFVALLLAMTKKTKFCVLTEKFYKKIKKV